MMQRSAAIFLKVTVMLLSLAAFTTSAWLWQRSRHFSDLYYRFEPVKSGGVAMRGVASMKGALVFGSIMDSTPRQTDGAYHHDIWAAAPKGGGSLLEARPDYKVGGLGFGVSHGQLVLNLPLAFMLPRRTYHAVFVPYYFIMLLAAVQPGRWAWKVYRSKRRISRSEQSFRPILGVPGTT